MKNKVATILMLMALLMPGLPFSLCRPVLATSASAPSIVVDDTINRVNATLGVKAGSQVTAKGVITNVGLTTLDKLLTGVYFIEGTGTARPSDFSFQFSYDCIHWYPIDPSEVKVPSSRASPMQVELVIGQAGGETLNSGDSLSMYLNVTFKNDLTSISYVNNILQSMIVWVFGDTNLDRTLDGSEWIYSQPPTYGGYDNWDTPIKVDLAIMHTAEIAGTGKFYFNIQDAIDAASSGDTIWVYPGTYYENQITIGKPLTVVSSLGADVTVIDGGLAALADGGLVRIIANTGDVTFSGFTLRNPGVTAAGDRFGIYTSSASAGPTYTISYNKIYGTNDPDDEGDYGCYGAWGKEKLVFTHNYMTHHGSNPILIEVHPGETDVSYNTLDEGVYGSVVYFSMTHDGVNITTLQKVSHNTINVGTGLHTGSDYYGGAIVFRSAYLGIYGNGTYTNVQITDNAINNLKGYRRAISLSNDASGNGKNGEISSPTITGNIITGTKETGSIGIQLRGLVTDPSISNNQIINVDEGVHFGKGVSGSHSPQAVFANNIITGCNTGINITDTTTATIDHNTINSNGEGIFIDSNNNIIRNNTITGNNGPFSGVHLTKTADGNRIYFNDIFGNSGTNVYGVYKEGGSTVNATYNYWGTPTGPYHKTLNPAGLGNNVSDYVEFIPWLPLVHDVAVLELTVSPSTVDSPTPISIKVKIGNQGSYNETFKLSVTYDSTEIFSENMIEMLPNSNRTFTHDWDTTGIRGDFTITANASKVPGETNVLNNVLSTPVEVLWHDVAVINIAADRTWVYQGHKATINVTVSNHGDYDETTKVTLYYNITADQVVGTQAIMLRKGESQKLTFVWDTTKVPYCHNYTMTATATIVPTESHPSDNLLEDGKIKVRILGDVDGNGLVNMLDLQAEAANFGMMEGISSEWNPDLDMNQDHIVNILDLFITATNFGKNCTP